MVEVLRLHLFLVGLAVVEIVEIGHDDRNRKRNGEHTSDGAQTADDLSPHSHGPVTRDAGKRAGRKRRVS